MSVFCSTLRSTSASAPQWRRCRRGPAPAATPRLVAAASAVLSAPKARFRVKRSESVSVQQRQRPLAEYMSLPASQYSVLDAERIERVDENTFRCYVYRLKFFSFEVCPVLLVRVEVEPYGCCIRLVSCKLEGSPIVVAQNEKFTASSCINRVKDASPSADAAWLNSDVEHLLWNKNICISSLLCTTFDIHFPSDRVAYSSEFTKRVPCRCST